MKLGADGRSEAHRRARERQPDVLVERRADPRRGPGSPGARSALSRGVGAVARRPALRVARARPLRRPRRARIHSWCSSSRDDRGRRGAGRPSRSAACSGRRRPRRSSRSPAKRSSSSMRRPRSSRSGCRATWPCSPRPRLEDARDRRSRPARRGRRARAAARIARRRSSSPSRGSRTRTCRSSSRRSRRWRRSQAPRPRRALHGVRRPSSGHSDDRVRAGVALVVAARAGVDSEPFLAKRLADPSERVRAAAIGGLAAASKPHGDALVLKGLEDSQHAQGPAGFRDHAGGPGGKAGSAARSLGPSSTTATRPSATRRSSRTPGSNGPGGQAGPRPGSVEAKQEDRLVRRAREILQTLEVSADLAAAAPPGRAAGPPRRRRTSRRPGTSHRLANEQIIVALGLENALPDLGGGGAEDRLRRRGRPPGASTPRGPAAPPRRLSVLGPQDDARGPAAPDADPLALAAREPAVADISGARLSCRRPWTSSRSAFATSCRARSRSSRSSSSWSASRRTSSSIAVMDGFQDADPDAPAGHRVRPHDLGRRAAPPVEHFARVKRGPGRRDGRRRAARSSRSRRTISRSGSSANQQVRQGLLARGPDARGPDRRDRLRAREEGAAAREDAHRSPAGGPARFACAPEDLANPFRERSVPGVIIGSSLARGSQAASPETGSSS